MSDYNNEEVIEEQEIENEEVENTQMQRVESLMKEMELILSSSSKEFQELGVKESTVKKNYEKSLDVIQETKKKLFKKENKLKSKLKKDLKNISNRKYYLIQEFQKAQLKKPEEQNSVDTENQDNSNNE